MNKSISASLKEYARGITGGLLFSLPILYTMEVWWTGFIASPGSLVALMCITFLVLLGYNRYAGLRPDFTWREIVIDSVEEMGLGLMIAFVVLLMQNRIQPENMLIDEILGKTLIEAMMISIGVSIGTAQLGEENGEGHYPEGKRKEQQTGKTALIVFSICGSLVIAGNVAPTEEVQMIAFESKPAHILAMAVASIVMSVVVVFMIDFKGSKRSLPARLFSDILFDTCICYTVALGISALTLWFYGGFENTGFWACFSQVIVLGVLASLGASAGRLLIK